MASILSRRPGLGPDLGWRARLALGAGLVVLLAALDLHSQFLGRLAAPLLGVDGGVFASVAGATALTLLLGLNVAVLRSLPFRLQVAIVWGELFVLFGAFAHSFDLSLPFIESKLGYLITQGAFTTVYVSAMAIVLASTLAMLGALAKMSRNGMAYGVAGFYISFFRGTPLLMQVYLIYLGLPQLGFVVDAIPAGVTALGLCYGAYMAEIFRSGIQAVPHGQWEAAAALGLSRPLTFVKIILPQAMRLIVPATGNQFIAMLKDSSLVSVLGVWELSFLARTQGKTEFRHIEMLLTAAVIYWLLSMLFEFLQARLEAYYGRGHTRA